MGPIISNPSSSGPTHQDRTVHIRHDAPSFHTNKHTQTDKTKHHLSRPLVSTFPIFFSFSVVLKNRPDILSSTPFRFVPFFFRICFSKFWIPLHFLVLSCTVSRVSSWFWRRWISLNAALLNLNPIFTGISVLFLFFVLQSQRQAIKWHFCQEIPP